MRDNYNNTTLAGDRVPHDSQEWRGDLRSMKKATLLPHKLIAITVATLFLFQIAMLATPMNDGFGKIDVSWKRWKGRTHEELSTVKRRTKSRRQKPSNASIMLLGFPHRR